MEKPKALVLLSGGLDSMLAARTLLEQGVEVVGITFISNFFGAERGLQAAKKLGIPLIPTNFAAKHLEMVKRPKHGYGKNMNPCIDCHAMMLAEAKEIMEGKEMVLVYPDNSIKAAAQKYDFIATGEVLGQRPMSQNGRALKIVADYSGVGDRLLRPLSAKLLPETLPEKEGKVDREKLLDINGRSRHRQVELAAHYGLTDYPSPAGGCLLTDPGFGLKLKEMFVNWPDCAGEDVAFIKLGRSFWFKLREAGVLVTVGRDEEENEKLLKLARPGDVIAEVDGVNGPVVVVHARSRVEAPERLNVEVPREIRPEALLREHQNESGLFAVVALLTGYYANRARGTKADVIFKIK